jgi:hypothetical protein
VQGAMKIAALIDDYESIIDQHLVIVDRRFIIHNCQVPGTGYTLDKSWNAARIYKCHGDLRNRPPRWLTRALITLMG